MIQQRRISVPRWALAILTGLMSAAIVAAVLLLALALDLTPSLLLGGALGLCTAFLVVRWFAAAGAVLSILEVGISALAAVVSIIAAVLGVFS